MESAQNGFFTSLNLLLFLMPCSERGLPRGAKVQAGMGGKAQMGWAARRGLAAPQSALSPCFCSHGQMAGSLSAGGVAHFKADGVDGLQQVGRQRHAPGVEVFV